jgi:hypothetical protein
MPVAATHAESHLDRGVGVPPGVGAKEDAMRLKLGPPLPPDDPIFSQPWTVFVRGSRPSTTAGSEREPPRLQPTLPPPPQPPSRLSRRQRRARRR